MKIHNGYLIAIIWILSTICLLLLLDLSFFLMNQSSDLAFYSGLIVLVTTGIAGIRLTVFLAYQAIDAYNKYFKTKSKTKKK